MSMTEGMSKEDRKKLIQEREQWTNEQRLNNMVKIVEGSDVRLQTFLGWIPRTYNGHKGLIKEDLMEPVVKAVRASALAEDQARAKYSSGKSNLCSGDSTTPSSERSGRPSEYEKDSLGFTPNSFISSEGKKRKRRSDAMTPIPLNYEDGEPVPLPPPTPKSVEQIVAEISPLPTRKKKGDGQRAVKALQDYLGQGTKEKAQNEAGVVLAARSGRPQRLGRKPPVSLEDTDAYEAAYQKIYDEVARRFDPSAYATERLRQAEFNKRYKAALKEFNDGLKAERAEQRAATKENREYEARLKAARAAERAEKKAEREASLADKRVPKKSQRAPRQEGRIRLLFANYNVNNARLELSNLLRTMCLSDAEKAMQTTFGPTFKLNADGTVPDSFNGSGFKRKVRRRINGQFY
jgi:ribosomal protein L19